MEKKRGKMLVGATKAQVSIFIIIAAFVIIASVLFFLYQSQVLENQGQYVQPEAAPVKLYVDNCIKTVAVEGLQSIGLTGGYIKVPESIAADPRAYLSEFPGNEFIMPYWWHDGISSVPTEQFMRNQLQEHVKAELKTCLDSFGPFKDKFEINALKDPLVEIKFNENDVSVSLEYPLEIISSDRTFSTLLEDFTYTIPIRFKKTYELAKLMMERENLDYFLERRTIDLYSMDTEIPTTDVEIRCSPKTWHLDNIRERLKELLRVNLPYIRIKGTDYNPNLYVPNPTGKDIYADSYFQHHYIWEVDKDSSKYKNMKVSFLYDNWPVDIYSRPSKNGILKSNAQKGKDMLSFFCLQIWHFTYDIKYPLIATVIDKETDKNKQYQFSFAFMVNVDHNQPYRVNKGITLFETAEETSSDEFCSQVQNEVTIFTVNNATSEDLRGVNLTFVCGKYYCDLGQSEWLSFGAASGISKKLPYCVNGIIKGAKEGFADAQSFVQSDIDGRSYILMMNPVKELRNYKVVKHKLSNPSVTQELSASERASILIKGLDNGFEGFATYPTEGDFYLKIPEGKDAKYEVTVYLVDNENIIGGYTGNWSVGRDALRDATQAIFHVIEPGVVPESERLAFMSSLSAHSKNVPQPELK